MVKTKITETTEKYDKDGKIVEKITREETSEDDTIYAPHFPEFRFGGELPFGSAQECDCKSGDFCKCYKEFNGDIPRFDAKEDGSVRITAENVFICQE